MTATPTLGHDAHAFIASALAATDTASAVRALRRPGRLDPAGLAAALLEEAENRLRREPRLAFWLAFTAARTAERRGLAAAMARGLYRAGEALANQGRMRGALRLYDRAIGRFHALGARLDVGAVMIRRIQPLAYLGRYDEAVAAGAAALRVFETLGAAHRLIEIENALGDLESRRDRPREALAHFRRARSLVEPTRNRRLVAILDVNSANCLEALHRFRAAERYFERARTTFAQEGLSHTVAQVDQNRAYFAFLRGRYAEALELYERAESAFSEIADTRDMAPIDLELAEVHLQLGLAEEARILARAAAGRFEREGRTKEAAQAACFAAMAEMVEGRGDVAARALLDARGRFSSLGDVPWVAECDLLRAHALAASADGAGESRALAESALAAFRDCGRPVRAASAEILLARLDLAAGRAAAALARLEQAAEATRRFVAPWLELELRRFQGLALLALGDADSGIESLERAAEVLETHRGGVPADEFMVAFLATKSALHAEIVGALHAAGRTERAFEYAERARSRALVDMMTARRGAAAWAGARSPGLAGVKAKKLREELNALHARLHRVETGRERVSETRRAAMARAVARHEDELAGLSREALARDREFASLTSVCGVTLAQVRERLSPGTTILEYFVTPRRLFVFVVSGESFIARSVEVEETELARRVHRFAFHLSKYRLGDDLPPAAADLSLRATRANLAELAQWLIAPVRGDLCTRRVVVVPHGVLHGVAFHALPDGDGWLCDEFDVAYAPSAAVLGFCAAKGPRAGGAPSVLALPDEAAPRIADEARSVARCLGPATLVSTGATATAARLREAVRESRLVHVATHGRFRADRPAMSSLRLADTWFNLYDVYDLDVRADLVVLSACESGNSAPGRGDEALGLLRGFLYAGAPRVLASRWRVSDPATELYMTSFYAALRDGATYEAAQRLAMRAVRDRHPHPFHWAAFCLVGNPEGRYLEVPSARVH